MTQEVSTPTPPTPTPTPAPTPMPPAQKNDSALAIVSMVLGVTSLTGPGFLFGIPAIITAIIALKKGESNKGLSITGLVTGSISTIVSLIFCAFLVWAIVWSANNPQPVQDTAPYPETGEMFNTGQI